MSMIWRKDMVYTHGQTEKSNFFEIYRSLLDYRYDGEWQNGKQHGAGTFVTEKGKKQKGTWENGEFINWE